MLRFLPKEKREAAAWRIIDNVFGFTEIDFSFIRTVKPNRREKRQLKEWLRVLKNEHDTTIAAGNEAVHLKSVILTTLILSQIKKYENPYQNRIRGTFAYDSLSET